MKKINLKAIGIGTIVDLAASLICGIIIGYFIGSNENLLPVYLIGGLSCIALGGYVAAKIADLNKLYNATFVGIAGIAIGIPFYASSPAWFSILSILFMPPSAYIGGMIAMKI